MIRPLLFGLVLAAQFVAVADRSHAAPFAGRIDVDNAAVRIVGGPDSVGGIDDWALTNGTLCAVVADPAHEGYVLPTGGSLVDLGYCGRADDQFIILEGLANLSRGDVTHWTSVEAQANTREAAILVHGERDGVAVTTRYALDIDQPETLHVSTRLERRAKGERLFAFGDVSIHYDGTLRPYMLAREGHSEGFSHRSTGDATVIDLMGSIVPVEQVALIGSRSAEAPISYSIRITGAHFESPGSEPRPVATFGLSTETVTFVGVLANPVWLGSDDETGLLQLAQTLFMDLEIGDAIVFERAIDVAQRTDAVAFTDASHPTAGTLRGTTGEADSRVHILDLDGSAVAFAAPDATGAFSFRLPPGAYEARVLASADRHVERRFEMTESDLDLGALPLPAAALVRIPADLAPARLAFRGIGTTPDPLFDDDHTGMQMEGAPKLAHNTSSHVALGGFAGDPEQVTLSPGRYRVLATRGPEFGITSVEIEVAAGETLELELDAPQRVLETPGLLSADLHIHADPSDDSTVPMRRRLASYLAEGGELIVSTDHDHVSDYAPLIAEFGLGDQIRSIVGLEITSTVATEAAPFTAGHSNVFPVPYRPLAHRAGAILSEGRRLRELIAEARAIPGERLFQLNHAREPESGAIAEQGAFFTHLSVGKPFDPSRPLDDPGHASLIERDSITGLRDLDFDAMELLNGSSMGRYRKLRTDWFSLLRQGERPTATGNSDTHTLRLVPGVPRNYVRMADDSAAGFDENEFIRNLKAGQSFVTTGPILDVRFAEPVRAGTGTLVVEVRSAPWIPVSQLRVFVNGELRHEAEAPQNDRIEVPLEFPADSFVVVEVEGEPSDTYAALLPDFVPFAHSNALFVDADEDGQWQPPGL